MNCRRITEIPLATTARPDNFDTRTAWRMLLALCSAFMLSQAYRTGFAGVLIAGPAA